MTPMIKAIPQCTWNWSEQSSGSHSFMVFLKRWYWLHLLQSLERSVQILGKPAT